ncbi:sec-independent protein translocase protein TatA/sec-independent protein translocase protein TatB [Verrucomicrobium sp. GAS474]|uniref:Sec-independent protein translocase subunit TatA/TatB n=1 Tax=Verrucomicrobium sp. GAS474 TaxID=1882831 RepID=UPI00087D1F31|nr:twin-arginine translocase TatA/TatE family subunit [Verrucomicrobium sp. GAS474]SDT86247.1 sec-independent protein translocase protein TatA/sec-independent protein translocase protein TatB [Verrucomicrobium sp. GAS474]
MHTTLPFFALLPHGMEFFWIFILFVLLFGAKKLPELARGLGKSLGEFKKAKDEFDREVKTSIHETPATPVTPATSAVPPALPTQQTIQPPATPAEVKKDAH